MDMHSPKRTSQSDSDSELSNLPSILSKEIQKRKKKKPVRSRSPYTCKRCNQPKKGHICTATTSPWSENVAKEVSLSSSPFSDASLFVEKAKENQLIDPDEVSPQSSPSPADTYKTEKNMKTELSNSNRTPVEQELSPFSSYDIAISSLDLLHSNLAFALSGCSPLKENENFEQLLANLVEEKYYLTKVRDALIEETSGEQEVNVYTQ